LKNAHVYGELRELYFISTRFVFGAEHNFIAASTANPGQFTRLLEDGR
jgi:hypothetical protein